VLHEIFRSRKFVFELYILDSRNQVQAALGSTIPIVGNHYLSNGDTTSRADVYTHTPTTIHAVALGYIPGGEH
jgi:hypothetical protein